MPTLPSATLAAVAERAFARPAVVEDVADAAWLVGHVDSARGLRTRLRAAGLPRRAVPRKGFWADGRRGL